MPADEHVVVVATITPGPDRMSDVRAALLRAIGRVHDEDEGCLLYALHEAPGQLVMIEKWATDEALEAHRHSDAYLELGRALRDSLAAAPDVQVLKAVPAGNDSQGRL